ncbi:response regulator [Desulfonema magnum]|uniref:Two component system response regulator, LuxR domain-containing n=1 Tax=Desulfonema magnum TaxID=45655 RepID=A0A975BXS6_9BACT|nr:response regulator transcription factor [Desulfonema magnum]QTA93114.1 Two component system response regulator, LuxR domain-containing [Desulfonema magnum]
MPKTKILIADDHRVVIEGIKSTLREYQEFEVAGEALNGREAVKLAESLMPKIVITDISMPDLNGLDTTLQIKKISSDIRIIIYTMYSDREFIIDLFKAGISAYVLKEDPISELILAIKAVNGGGTYFSTMAPTILLRHIKTLEEGNIEENIFKILSLREREVFQLLAEGNSTKNIAHKLCISPKTVESHKYNIMAKLDLESIADLIRLAIRKKIIPL